MQEDKTHESNMAHLMAAGAARPLLPLIAPTLRDMGFHLVRLQFQSGVLQVMAENTQGTLSLDECETISHALSALLDVEDPISGTYRLEVSSAGLDRPLTRVQDFETHMGERVSVQLIRAQKIVAEAEKEKARGRAQGTLVSYNQDALHGAITLEVNDERTNTNAQMTIEISNLRSIRLISEPVAKTPKRLFKKSQKH